MDADPMKTILALSISALGLALLSGCQGQGTSPAPNLGIVGVWATTSVSTGGGVYTQQDRLANPVVNEVFATFANDRHKINNLGGPTQDPTELASDIQSFMTAVAGRSQATTDVVKSVFRNDTMLVDLRVAGSTGAYLGVQTGGATGSTFGGRELTDDVVDISLGVVFGTTVSALGLAPADGNEIPTLTSDNVDASGKHFLGTFPYLGDPR